MSDVLPDGRGDDRIGYGLDELTGGSSNQTDSSQSGHCNNYGDRGRFRVRLLPLMK